MDRLRRLFGRGRQLNPEQYERVRCDRCNGTGKKPWTSGTGYFSVIPCGSCDGKGRLLVPTDADDAHHRPEDHPGPVTDAQRTTAGPHAEADTAADVRQSDLPDVPDAPTAPSPPLRVSDSDSPP